MAAVEDEEEEGDCGVGVSGRSDATANVHNKGCWVVSACYLCCYTSSGEAPRGDGKYILHYVIFCVQI